MLIPDCSNGSVEAERGGFADVSQGIHQERLVAIKVVRVYITSDLDVIRSVSFRPASSHLYEQTYHRASAERESPGSIFGIQTYYRCLE
jgi:hypothetical protein